MYYGNIKVAKSAVTIAKRIHMYMYDIDIYNFVIVIYK